MRVVAGELRGRRLVAPPGEVTRPTSDRVRQATFNAIESRIDLDGAVVVDLFAGSGALGIEALSRGAGQVTFVERDRQALGVVRANLAALGLDDRARIVAADATSWRPAAGAQVDLVVTDPPYDFDDWARALGAWPAELVVVESDRLVEPSGWRSVRSKRYGAATVTLLVPSVPDADAVDTEH